MHFLPISLDIVINIMYIIGVMRDITPTKRKGKTMRLQPNTYKRLDDGTWGAYINTGFGKTKRATPEIGSTVDIMTRAGEIHKRIVAGYIKHYASGVVVALADDAAVAAKAEERYAEKANEHKHDHVNDNQPCPYCHTYCYGDCRS